MWPDLAPDPTRDALLNAALVHVPFDRWSEKALLAGADDIGVEAASASRAFPGGALALIAYHAGLADRRMEEALSQKEIRGSPIRERIAMAVRLRLEQNVAHREAVRAALAILTLPQNGPLALRCLYRTVDAIWFAIGDTSTDFNFYSKRALLAGVYLSTLLYWLNDSSDHQAETWRFLDRRIADVLRIQKARGRLERFSPPFMGLLRELRRGTRTYRGRQDWAWRRPEEPPPENSTTR